MSSVFSEAILVFRLFTCTWEPKVIWGSRNVNLGKNKIAFD
jgi:hypothetical protein